MPSSATILCVDDDPKVLWLRASLLSIAGYHVVTAPNAEAALQLFRDRPIDLVITEYFPPDSVRDGLVSAMKRHKPEIPVLLYTAYPEASESFGHADKILAKGMAPAEFLTEVANLIARSQA